MSFMSAHFSYLQILCPMSMTDGTARVIELMGSPKMKEEIFPRLIR